MIVRSFRSRDIVVVRLRGESIIGCRYAYGFLFGTLALGAEYRSPLFRNEVSEPCVSAFLLFFARLP